MKKHIFMLIASSLCSAAMAQSVTVGTTGADYTSLNAAIVAVGANPATPDVITILDEGPFFESRIIINAGVSGTADLTIQASPGVRPIIVVDQTDSSSKTSAVYLRKTGNLIFKDMIILPASDGVIDESSYLAKVANHGIEIFGETNVDTSLTLQNILVSSNNGSNRPVAALDGLTPPVFTPNTTSFLDNGVHLLSVQPTNVRHVYMYDVVVSGVDGKTIENRFGPPTGARGNMGTDGIRGFIDGLPGSQWVLGPGCTVSYNALTENNHTSSSARAAFQPGGTAGFEVRVKGTPDKPVKLINNKGNGIAVTNSAGAADGLVSVEWCIAANNSGAGMSIQDDDTPVNFSNVTIANNLDGVFRGTTSASEVTYSWSNVVAAGNGGPTNLANVIQFIGSANASIFPSSFTASHSAIVLNGPYTLNNVNYGADGIAHESPWTVTTSNIINTDPQFVSLDPANPGFAVITNQAYGTAGPAGQPLVGGGRLAPSSVEDWQLF